MVWRHYWDHKSSTLNTNGMLLGPWRTQPAADKHCQLAEGPYSSAMCSHLINKTHSLHQVQTNTKPFPWALVFSSYPYLCQLKRLYYDDNCETTLRSVVEKRGLRGVEKEQTSYCIAPLFRFLRDSLPKGPNKNHALGLAFLNTFWRGQELRIDQFLMAAYFFTCLEWFE